MDISKHSNGVKVGAGNSGVFINPASEVDSGIVIYTDTQGESETNDERLIIEGPGEYESAGIYIKGIKKNGVLSFVISYNDREVYFTGSDGISDIPEDAMYDAVVIETNEKLDPTKINKISYPTIYLDKGNVLDGKIEAEKIKNVNLKKITPEEKNIYILQ